MTHAFRWIPSLSPLIRELVVDNRNWDNLYSGRLGNVSRTENLLAIANVQRVVLHHEHLVVESIYGARSHVCRRVIITRS